jgi:hypothetical protein
MIVVVSGLPRSGTSLMMQMLAAGGVPILSDGVRVADENNPRGYLEWEPAKKLREQPEAIAAAKGKAVKAISALLVGLPARHEYRVIFMRRPVAEVVRSQAAMIQRLGTKSPDVSEERMIAVMTNHQKQVEDWLAKQTFVSVLPVEYHSLLADPMGESRRVAGFLAQAGVPADVEAMARQVDPGLYRTQIPGGR